MKQELLQYVPLARFLKEALGERYQISLVDADCTEKVIDITERGFTEGGTPDPVNTEILKDILNSTELKKTDYLCSVGGIEAAETEKKISVFFIREKTGEILGFLKIEEKREGLYMVKDVFNELLVSEGQQSSDAGSIGQEVDSLLKERITEVWERHTASAEKMRKAEKVAFISELFEMGIFRIRGAAAQVCEVTGISQASIYRYLGEVLED